MARSAPLDPLLQAVIGKLPRAGEFRASERAAWLNMMMSALDCTYGAADLEWGHAHAAAGQLPPPLSGQAPEPPKPIAPGPRFYIDAEGFARRQGGDRVLATEVSDILVDQRGQNGDLATITWADGTMGIPKGLQLDIGI